MSLVCSHLSICAAPTDQSSCSDQLVIDYKLPVWEHLHGFWRTLLNFNPHTASSEPGQNLEGKARNLLFPSHGNGNADKGEPPEGEIGNKIKDPGLLGMVEGAAGDIDIDIGLEGYDDDAPNKVRGYTYSC